MSDLDLLVARMRTAGALRVYKVNEVPDEEPGAYTVLGLDFGLRRSTRVSGDSPGLTRRLTAQLNGSTYDAVTDMVRIADLAFYDQTLTELAGAPFSVRELSVGPIRDPDGGSLLYVLNTYRFGAP